jgi:hypothetical protein
MVAVWRAAIEIGDMLRADLDQARPFFIACVPSQKPPFPIRGESTALLLLMFGEKRSGVAAHGRHPQRSLPAPGARVHEISSARF